MVDVGEMSMVLLAQVESQFDLVMIAEYMEVSLVLLKELMCWSLDDVTFFTLNARSAASHAKLTAWERRRISELNSADGLLYDHFLRRFRLHVQDFGAARMHHEVEALLRRNAELYRQCIKVVLPPAKPDGAYNDVRYQLHDDLGDLGPLCRLITVHELDFTAQLRDQQARRLKVLSQLDDLFQVHDDDRQSPAPLASR
ncbi:hypothetical protein PR048_018040 [Dryococelus australis]|uniref:Uncharacterized protein n=1 Tax=Dryococelus australis TaxID=614101 RepID=A0ABQ9HBA4_9NEOP|nr:hypothetical protein PR048_018040 [Dryococelus australis]